MEESQKTDENRSSDIGVLREEKNRENDRMYVHIAGIDIIKEDPDGTQMLLQNDIKGILKMECRRIDGEEQYYYDVTGLHKLSEILRLRKMRIRELKQLLFGISEIVERAGTYFLESDGFVLVPEHIYLHNASLFSTSESVVWLKKSMLRLCYQPGYKKEFSLSLNSLLEYLLNQIDYKDEEAVSLIYQMYQLSSENHCSIRELIMVFESDTRMIPTREEWRNQEGNIIAQKERFETEIQRDGYQLNDSDIFTKDRFTKEKLTKEKILKDKLTKDKLTGETITKGKKTRNLFALFLGVIVITFGILYYNGFFISPISNELDWSKLLGTAVIFIIVGSLTAWKIFLRKNGEVSNENKIREKKAGRIGREENSRLAGKEVNRLGRGEVDRFGREASDSLERKEAGRFGREASDSLERKEVGRFGREASDSLQREEVCRLGRKEIDRIGRKEFDETEKAEKIENNPFSRKEYVMKWERTSVPIANTEQLHVSQNSFQKREQKAIFDKSDMEHTQLLSEMEKTQLLSDMEKTELLSNRQKESETEEFLGKGFSGKEKEKYLLLPAGDKDLSEIPIEEFPFFLGKIPLKGKNLLPNRSISRFHAKIEQEGERFYLSDLDSTNGTFLNHIRIKANQPQLLEPGDEIMFADAVYRFVLAK